MITYLTIDKSCFFITFTDFNLSFTASLPLLTKSALQYVLNLVGEIRGFQNALQMKTLLCKISRW